MQSWAQPGNIPPVVLQTSLASLHKRPKYGSFIFAVFDFLGNLLLHFDKKWQTYFQLWAEPDCSRCVVLHLQTCSITLKLLGFLVAKLLLLLLQELTYEGNACIRLADRYSSGKARFVHV